MEILVAIIIGFGFGFIVSKFFEKKDVVQGKNGGTPLKNEDEDRTNLRVDE